MSCMRAANATSIRSLHPCSNWEQADLWSATIHSLARGANNSPPWRSATECPRSSSTASSVVIGRPKGETYYFEASYGFSREYAEYAASHPAGIDRTTVSGRVLLERKIVHVHDALADPEYTYWGAGQSGGFRTLLGVPLLREGPPIGVIALGRNSERPFTDKQIELVTTFADQAVIAIENVRLFDEVQARTRELSESLEQQTASSEVLQVISSSPGELEPVFQAMLANATRICDAKFGMLYLWEGDAFRAVAFHN